MNNLELAAKVKDIATHYKTLYVMGCIGAPLNAANKKRYTQNHSYNMKPSRVAKINAATSDTFGFDCVCLIKSVLWGWCGNKNATYGGAKYASNGVPDIGADAMITQCNGVSTDFSNVEIGEALWCKGHIGVYIGDGLAVECTPKWEDKVQITAVDGIHPKTAAYNFRKWSKHGKLPYIDYVKVDEPKKTIDELAKEVIDGKWGSQPEREKNLTAAGYDYKAVQKRVNEILAAAKVLIGDIDGDKRITAADARLVLRAAVGSETLNDIQKAAADADGDGKITAADARLILRKAVGLEK